MNIVLADDHGLFRTGLAIALVQALGPETTITEAKDYADLFAAVAGEPGPDLVLCDLMMPDAAPFEGLRQLVRLIPDVPVMVISASGEADDIQHAIECGAKGYILKQQTFEVLKLALRLVLAGGSYLPAEAFGTETKCAALSATDRRRGGADGERFSDLSRQQQVVLDLLCRGLSNKEIARVIGIAEGTVKAQLRTVYRKLGVRNRTEAALLARGRRGKQQRTSGIV